MCGYYLRAATNRGAASIRINMVSDLSVVVVKNIMCPLNE